MKYILFLFLMVILFSCKNTQKTEIDEEKSVQLSKLEQLYLLPKDSVYEFYDLSDDSIKKFPDLSQYSIKKIDLSYNQIDSLIIEHLPKQLEKIDLSHNSFSNHISFEIKKPLKEFDLSHNKITDCYIEITAEKFKLNNNNLEDLTLVFEHLNYLDISNNPKLSNIVGFKPEYVDTIMRENIKNNQKLIFVVDSWSKTIE